MRWLFAVLAMLLISCTSRQARIAAPPGTPGAAYDRDFLQNRIAHQRAAIEMTRACEQKAVHQELRQFCATLSGTENEESNQLQQWLNQWFGASPLLEGHERDTRGYRNFLGSVRNSSGADFEQAFLSALRLHHHEGVTESQDCERRGTHPDLKSLCSRMVGEQENEIKQMNTWICSWYRDCVEK